MSETFLYTLVLFFGFYHVFECQIVYPSIVNRYGELQTTNLLAYENYLVNDKIWYRFLLNKQTVLIDLTLNRHQIPKIRQCQFKGIVNQDLKSRAAFSVCHGLVGSLNIDNKIYHIKPTGLIVDSWHEHSVVLLKEKLRDEKIGSRIKRSISREHVVETLIVADKSMADYHENENVEEYILTIMNIVESLYSHVSLENVIKFDVVRIIILEDEKEFKLETNATSLLENFCMYQDRINYPEWHPSHHDFAILLTKTDICADSNEPCETLGLAQMGGMCNLKSSCSVNEDNGLSLAITVAHEIGHSFNAEHNTPECEQEGRSYMMNSHLDLSSHLNSDSQVYLWSKCSSDSITKFLDSKNVSCLEDQNSEVYKKNSLPAGLSYDFNLQCQFAFGKNATHCPHRKDFKEECSEVSCQLNDQVDCVTKSEKAAEGTLCGGGFTKWCIEGKCVPIETFETKPDVDGEWGEWSEWSNCSRECNSGIQFKQRSCNNPAPMNKGKYCLGERKIYQVCNTELCLDRNYDQNFKNEQCKNFSSYLTKNQKANWTFNFLDQDSCRFYCTLEGEDYFEVLNYFAQDGTPCSHKKNSLCIAGVCEKFGCDWVMDSKKKKDYCGVCGGNNSTCNILNGTILFSTLKNGDYEPVLILPTNATNVKLSKQGYDFNYLAVRNANGHYYLNGEFRIASTGEFKFDDMSFDYVLNSNEETIKFHNKLNENLYIMLLNFQPISKIFFEYALPNGYQSKDRLVYYWNYNDEWTICSKSCGKGWKSMEPSCFEIVLGKVDDSFCPAESKPESVIESCNVFECAADWWIGEWQACSGLCSNEQSVQGLEKRSVKCIIYKPNKQNNNVEILGVPEVFCNISTRPVDGRECMMDCSVELNDTSSAYWIHEEWTNNCERDACVRAETRVVRCSDMNAICDLNKRPASEKYCNHSIENVKCGIWVPESWSKCTGSCPEGVRFRNVTCIDGELCSIITKPHSQETCEIKNCDLSINHSDYFDQNLDMNMTLSLNDLVYSEQNLTLLRSKRFLNENDQFYNATELYEELNQTLPESSPQISQLQFKWETGNFGPCTNQCGGGLRSRKVVCYSKNPYEQVEDSMCEVNERPNSFEICNVHKCREWIVSAWGECSQPCGTGFKTRQVTCDVIDQCDLEKFPVTEKACNMFACHEWVAGEWNQCSQTCGLGIKTRRVSCFSHLTNSTSDLCNHSIKPKILEKCVILKVCPHTTSTSSIDLSCRDIFEKKLCKKIKYSNRCSEPRLSSQCCQTCNNAN